MKQLLVCFSLIFLAFSVGCGSKKSSSGTSDTVSGTDSQTGADTLGADGSGLDTGGSDATLPDASSPDTSGSEDTFGSPDSLSGEDASSGDTPGDTSSQADLADDTTEDVFVPECTKDEECGPKLGTLKQCQEPACNAGICEVRAKKKGSGCDDANGCTAVDECDGEGECVGTTNPCVDTADACKQEANAECTSTGNATYTCAYPKNVSGNVGCDDGNVCTVGDLCGADGTCLGTPRFGDPCKPSDADYGICGQYGDCAPIRLHALTPTGGEVDHSLLAVCQPPNEKPYVFLSQLVSGDLKVTVSELDPTKPTAPFGAPADVAQWTRANSFKEARVHCSRDHALVLEGDRNALPTTIQGFLRKVQSGWESRPNWKTAMGKILNWNWGQEDEFNRTLRVLQLGGIFTQPETTTPRVYVYGWYKDPEISCTTLDRQSYLVFCDETSGTGTQTQYSCLRMVDLNNVAWCPASHITTGMHAVFRPTETKVWTLTSGFADFSDESKERSATWFSNFYQGTNQLSGGWTNQPLNGGPGALQSDPFYHALRPYSETTGYSRRRGYYSIDGFDDQLVVAVGDGLSPLFRTDLPLKKPTNDVVFGRLVVYQVGKGFVVADAPPSESLLVPAQGAPTPVVREYVYRQVKVLDSETVVIVGYELSCSESNKDDCYIADTTVKMRLRPFVVVYRPLEDAGKRWGKMVPLEDGLSYECCNRVSGTCGSTPACGALDFWASYPRSIALTRMNGSLSLIVGASWADAPNSVLKRPRLWWFSSNQP